VGGNSTIDRAGTDGAALETCRHSSREFGRTVVTMGRKPGICRLACHTALESLMPPDAPLKRQPLNPKP
jgi:hypothetical protein